jgi:uncharacterized protein DUF6880
MERQIEQALRPGEFIYDRACSSFVSGLEQVAAEINKVITSEPSRAVTLCEAFLAGCHAKAEELDDSSGRFGMFAQDLICLWIKARQSGGADPDKTAATLLAWMEDDPHAFCFEIEKDAAAAFDKSGLSAFEKQVQARFQAATGEPSRYPYRRWSAILRAIYLAQRNIAAYVALAEQTGLTPQDCLAVAKLLVRRKPENALVWIERGRALDQKSRFRSAAAYDLDQLLRELLTKLGRGSEALEAAWADFREHPSKYSFDDLMKFVPKGARAEWHEKAMDAATGADLHSSLELFVETKEMERLAELVRGAADEALKHVSHHATEPAARKLGKSHPELAARLWLAQGLRIVDAKKSKYYDAALSNLERARDCYQRAGQAAEWEKIVRKVCSAHSRKTGFIDGFQALAAGAKRGDRPSFLERAKQRWAKGTDHEKGQT